MSKELNSELYGQTITVLPLKPISNQTTTFIINGSNYSFLFKWDATISCWLFDISDSSETLKASGIKLIPDFDLLLGYRELKRLFGQSLAAIELKTGDYQVFDNLGSSVLLCLVASVPSYDSDGVESVSDLTTGQCIVALDGATTIKLIPSMAQ